MEQDLNGTVGEKPHRAVLVSAEEKLLTCNLFGFRIAPVPKYLKMHYVKEELGDSKGGVGR